MTATTPSHSMPYEKFLVAAKKISDSIAPAEQLGVLLDYFDQLGGVSGGLSHWLKVLRATAVSKHITATRILESYRLHYADAFGEVEEADEAAVALLLDFGERLDEIAKRDPTFDVAGRLADYLEELLNPDGERPPLSEKDFLGESLEAKAEPEPPAAAPAARKKGKKKDADAPLPGQQALPFPDEPAAEPPFEPQAPKKFRAPGRDKDWTGQRITYKANDQKVVVGRVTADSAGRLWFTDEHGDTWGGDEGVDKARCKAVAPVAADPAVGRKPDVVLALSTKESKLVREVAAATTILSDYKPGQTLCNVEKPIDDRFSVRLRVCNSHDATQRPFLSLVALDNKSTPAMISASSPPAYDPAVSSVLNVGGREVVVGLQLAAV